MLKTKAIVSVKKTNTNVSVNNVVYGVLKNTDESRLLRTAQKKKQEGYKILTGVIGYTELVSKYGKLINLDKIGKGDSLAENLYIVISHKRRGENKSNFVKYF